MSTSDPDFLTKIRSEAVERLADVIGQLPADLVKDLETAIRLHLGL